MRKGWFIMDGQDGDRTVDEQALGLEGYDFTGKTVLDLGCAEGLISAYVLMHGAKLVHGCEIIKAHLDIATRMMEGHPAQFWKMDLSNFEQLHKKSMRISQIPMLPRYDVVLLLSIVHKLKEPAVFLEYVMTLSDSLIIRLPARILKDARSDFREVDIPRLLKHDFDLIEEPKTCREEWLGIFKRR